MVGAVSRGNMEQSHDGAGVTSADSGLADLTPKRLTMSGVLAGGLIAATTLVNLPRLTPIGNGDFFSFVSVAERMRAGDRLYVDVWDNKDPYFYYLLSLVGSLGAWAYVVLELAWVAMAVLGLYALARSQGISRSWSLTVAWGAAPWCLLGIAYAGTMSVMPGVALAIGVVALAAQNRWAGVGSLLGVLVLLKITLVPVAVAGALVFCTDHRARALLRATIAGAASTTAGLAILGLRGELNPYLSALRQNSEYAARMVDAGGLEGFVEHLDRVFPPGGYPGERIALSAIIGGIVLAAWLRRARRSRLLLCAVTTLLSSVLVLGLTAIWVHHAQILAVPASMTLLALFEGGSSRRPARLFAALCACVATAYLMGGVVPVSQVIIKPVTAAQPLQQLSGISPEAASIADDPGLATYSRLGRNDRDAHARGLGELVLMCRDFQQYPFDPEQTFARTLDCLPQSDVVFVADNFADQTGTAEYARFTTRARSILERQFICIAAEYGKKCTRASS